MEEKPREECFKYEIYQHSGEDIHGLFLFKQGIGIAENNQETRRDHWGGYVNHKCLF